MIQTVEYGEGKRITQAAANTDLSDAMLIGFLCESSSSGTLTIADKPNGSARTLLSAMALVAGQFYPLKVRTAGAVTITIGGTGAGLLTFSS